MGKTGVFCSYTLEVSAGDGEYRALATFVVTVNTSEPSFKMWTASQTNMSNAVSVLCASHGVCERVCSWTNDSCTWTKNI
jgi:hypothetical protein